MRKLICPECSETRIGQDDAVLCFAEIEGVQGADNEIVWEGTTEICWDTQRLVLQPPTFSCHSCGHTGRLKIFLPAIKPLDAQV